MHRALTPIVTATACLTLGACAGAQKHSEDSNTKLDSDSVGTMTVVEKEPIDEGQAQDSQGQNANAQPETDSSGTLVVGVLQPKFCDERLSVFFEVDSKKLDQQDKQSLSQLASCLQDERQEQLSIEVAGHADPRGTQKYNEQLSEERAKAVVDYLRSKGVDDASYEIVAKGEKGASDLKTLWPLERRTEVDVDR